MSEHYNQNYTKENIQFIQDYNLKDAKQKAIILSIETTDFCHSLQNTNIGYEYETLYVFCPQRALLMYLAKKSLYIFIQNLILLNMKIVSE